MRRELDTGTLGATVRPARRFVAGPLLGTAAAVLALAVLAWVIGSPFDDRQREQPSPSSDEPSRPAACSLPVGGTVLVLKISVGNDVATVETMSGTMAADNLSLREGPWML